MGLWSFIAPEAITNKITNPSFETNTTGWSASGTNTIARDNAQSKFGGYSLLATYQNNTVLATFAGLVLTAAAHYISAWVFLPANWDGGAVRLAVANFTSVVTDAASSTTTATGKWVRLTMGITPDAGDLTGDIQVSCASAPTAGRTIYIDGVQVEAKGYATTYVDGDQLGCVWTGTKHASTSTRSAQYRGGGKVVDIDDTYGVNTSAMSGFGMPPVQHNALSYALLPGGQFQSLKTMPRSLILTFKAHGTTLANLHTKRDQLIEAFKPDKVLPIQPVRLRYTGNSEDVEIDAVYDGGLEGQITWRYETMAARFVCYDPHFHTLGSASKPLNNSLSVASADYAVKKVDGVWTNISTDFNSSVLAICRGSDGSIYIGGAFTNVGDANGDYIVKVAPDGTISSLGTGANNTVRAIVEAPNGDIIAGGDFTLMGGVANTVRIARWDGSIWAPLSTGIAGGGGDTVNAMCFDQSGNLYVAGIFTNHVDANGDHITKWDGTSFSSLGTGLASGANALALGPDGSLYVGGTFSLAGGVSNTAKIAKWDGSVFTALSTGAGDNINALAFGPDGILYAGGLFTTIGGVSCNRVAAWNGTAWTPLGTGMNGAVFALAVKDSLLYAGGTFTQAGGLALADRMAGWNGSSWVHLDLDLPSTPTINRFTLHNFDLYIGYDTLGTATASQATTVTNSGSATVYPKIVIKRSGGTSARVEWIKNETTGQVLYCNYSLLDGETLTIDLDYQQDPTVPATRSSGRKKITSDFFGNAPRAILRGSDEAEFCLQPGDNVISVYINQAGSPTMTCFAEWREAHWSVDTVAA